MTDHGVLKPGLPPASEIAPSNLARQGLLSGLGIAVQGVPRFVFSVVVGNAFGKVILGTANSAISLAMFASLLLPYATSASAAKFISRARGNGDLAIADILTNYLLRKTVLAALVLGSAGALTAPFVLDVSATDAALTGALIVTYSGYIYLRGAMYGLGLVRRATTWDLLSAATAIAAIAAVVIMRLPGIVLAPLTIGYGLYIAVNWPTRAPATLGAPLQQEVDRFLRVTLVNSLAVGGLIQLSMVVARAVEPVGAGSYAAALSLATPAALVSRSISLVLMPSLAAAFGRGDHEGMRAQVDGATRVLSVISVATFGPLMILSPLVVATFYRRPGFQDASELLIPLLLAVLLLNVVIGPVNSLLTREHQHARVVMYSGLAGMGTGGLFWLWGVPALGVHGVALGYLFGSAVMAMIPLLAIWRLEEHAWFGLWARFAVGTGLATAFAVGVQRIQADAFVQLGLTGAFLLLWGAISLRDLRLTTRLLLGHPLK